jgi:hypothetical protein
MGPLREILENYDRIWQQAESYLSAYFAVLREQPAGAQRPARRAGPQPEPPASKSKSRNPKSALPNPRFFKDFAAALTLLKRIQDARRAIHHDLLKLEAAAPNGNGQRTDIADHEAVSRTLGLLEADEKAEGADEEPL